MKDLVLVGIMFLGTYVSIRSMIYDLIKSRLTKVDLKERKENQTLIEKFTYKRYKDAVPFVFKLWYYGAIGLYLFLFLCEIFMSIVSIDDKNMMLKVVVMITTVPIVICQFVFNQGKGRILDYTKRYEPLKRKKHKNK